jgi:pyruvate,water dikinase
VYEGTAEIETAAIDLTTVPRTRTQVMLNLANPAAALRWWPLPADGVGLARMEFVVTTQHPMALVHFDAITDPAVRQSIETLTADYPDKTEYFVDRLARGLARIAALAYPKSMILRTSDFKSNEYANLIGGSQFEVPEENPMIGLRGASRYYSPRYEEAFAHSR